MATFCRRAAEACDTEAREIAMADSVLTELDRSWSCSRSDEESSEGEIEEMMSSRIGRIWKSDQRSVEIEMRLSGGAWDVDSRTPVYKVISATGVRLLQDQEI